LGSEYFCHFGKFNCPSINGRTCAFDAKKMKFCKVGFGLSSFKQMNKKNFKKVVFVLNYLQIWLKIWGDEYGKQKW